MATAPQPRSSIDDPLLARLERLTQRQLPPPVPPTQRQLPPPGQPTRGQSAPGRVTPPKKRRHPAKGARLGALAVSCVTTGGLSVLFATSNASDAGASGVSQPVITVAPAGAANATPVTSATTPATTPAITAPATTSAAAAPETTAITAPATTATPATTAAAVPTTFDGSVVNTRYGPVQVQIQVTNGTLTEVAIVEYPSDDRKSQRINAEALPILRSEALTAQSANVDTVSGATYTSNGYAQSLQAAIDSARAAGATVNA